MRAKLSKTLLLMMTKDGPSHAGLLVNGRLEDLLIDQQPSDRRPSTGDIYRARIDRLAKGIGGAFVTLEPGQEGYLRDAGTAREGAIVPAQVSACAEPEKAAPVTLRPLIKRRCLIFTPHAPGTNVSRKIKDEAERARLIELVESWQPSSAIEPSALDWFVRHHREGGYILRTASASATAPALHAEIEEVLGRWYLVAGDHPDASSRGRILPARAMDTALSEWVDDEVDEIVCDPHAGRDIDRWQTGEGAGLAVRVRVEKDIDLFDHFGVWDEIERLHSPRVNLPSGGWMAIEATRAMVTVDVNTGGEFSGGAAVTANIEAARELPRQLRLRGLGGQVIVDFAPLKKMQRKQIEDALKTAFRKDPIETTLAGWTPLGNFEMTRKRERRPLAEFLPE